MISPKSHLSASFIAAIALISIKSGAAIKTRGMDLCTSFSKICTDLTSQLDCSTRFDGVPSKNVVAISACQSGSYDTYIGQCQCAGFDASDEVLHELVDYSIDDAMPTLLQTTTGKIDFPATFTKACGVFLNGSKCPTNMQTINAYSGTSTSLSKFKGDCSCGTIDASEIVRDAIIGFMSSSKFEQSIVNDESKTNVNLCQSFSNACGAFLTDIDCSSSLRTNRGCVNADEPDSLAAVCKCGSLDASYRLKYQLVSYVAKSSVETAKVYAQGTTGLLDMCSTYNNVCTSFLGKVNVSSSLQNSDANCRGSGGTNLATFNPTCKAGSLDVSSAITDLIVEKSIEDDVPDLVCIGDECAPYRMSAGVLAIVIISAVLAFVGLLGYAYQRGHVWARALLTNPLVNRVLTPFTFFSRRRHAKESPHDNNTHEMHLRGAMA